MIALVIYAILVLDRSHILPIWVTQGSVLLNQCLDLVLISKALMHVL
jgi:hypothetical protein